MFSPRTNNLYSGIPDAIPAEIFDVLIDTGILRLERIVSRGQATPPGEWLLSPRQEWVVLLKGRAALLFENDPRLIELNPGDHVHIPVQTKHRVEWTSPDEETIWLALHHS